MTKLQCLYVPSVDGHSSFITGFSSLFNFPLDQENESLLALASVLTTLVSRQLLEHWRGERAWMPRRPRPWQPQDLEAGAVRADA